MAICCTIRDLGIKHAITSKIEHHAVLHTLEEMEKQGKIKLSFVKLKKDGHVDLEHLEELLSITPFDKLRASPNPSPNGEENKGERSLVSLMHANNEIGNLLPIKKVSELCEKHNAIFHSDTVQTMCHYVHDLQQMKVHFITCSAHKFHGPKGIGFLYINNKVKIKPLLFGGTQERNMRGGTENVYGIVGLAKAFDIAHREMEQHQKHIQGLKSYMIEQLKKNVPDISFNGDSENGLYTVLNVSFPPSDISEMLLFKLDIEGIACSGGSACSSGSEIGSHVLRSINANPERAAVRFSFSKYNTKPEVDYCIEKLKELFAVKV